VELRAAFEIKSIIMAVIEIESRVGPDGVLTLAVPVGSEHANREVKVTISELPSKVTGPKMTQSEWEDFIRRTAGSIDDPTFVRHPQGQFEDRGPIFP
jgi:hypothetical protein